MRPEQTVAVMGGQQQHYTAFRGGRSCDIRSWCLMVKHVIEFPVTGISYFITDASNLAMNGKALVRHKSTGSAELTAYPLSKAQPEYKRTLHTGEISTLMPAFHPEGLGGKSPPP